MKKIGLSVYGMSISKEGVEKQNLNNINQKGVINILTEYIDMHLDEYSNDRRNESLLRKKSKKKFLMIIRN